MTLEFVDSHTHLDSREFDEDREEVIERAVATGVTKIINIGASDGIESSVRSIKLAEEYPFIWASVGIHPHDTEIDVSVEEVRDLAQHNRVVAIGETGLDFYRDWSPKELQIKWFRQHIELALELKKPLVIHSREAGEDCFQILSEMQAQEVGGVFHCFAENSEFAARLREINFLVSFPGVVSFKKAFTVHDAVKNVPLSQMMIETDAPYLAPVPYRGKRCEGAYVVETARCIAELRGCTLEEVAEATTTNAKAFYKI